MSSDFKYLVVSVNSEGNSSTARFISAKSAYLWARRLKEEGIQFAIKSAIKVVDMSLADLKKEAGPCSVSKKRTRHF